MRLTHVEISETCIRVKIEACGHNVSSMMTRNEENTQGDREKL